MELKAVHLAASAKAGGAASALINLHTGLLQIGVGSSILTGDGDPSESPRMRIVSNPMEPLNRMIYRELIHPNRTPISNTHFSFDTGGISLSAITELLEADVIHLHWVANYLTSPSLSALASLRKPVIWTLHDMRPFTGGCHYSAGCQGFRERCQSCPQLDPSLRGFPESAHTGQFEVVRLLQPAFVAPSRWLAGECQSSSVAGSSHVEVIPYGIDASIFTPMHRQEARARLGLEQDVLYIMLGAHSFEETRKGALLAQQALHGLARDSSMARIISKGNVRVVSCGAAGLQTGAPWHSQHLGYLSKQEMASLYSASDLMLFTAEEDNLPTMILEAMACGLPVVAYGVGGVPELVEEGETGFLAHPFEAARLCEHLKTILLDPELGKEMGRRARNAVTARFTLDVQARLYRDLYVRHIARRPAAAAPVRVIPETNSSSVDLALNSIERKREALSAENAVLAAENAALNTEKIALINENRALRAKTSDLHAELSLLRKSNHYLRRLSLFGFVTRNLRLRWRLCRRRWTYARHLRHLIPRLLFKARRSRLPK